MKISEKHHTDAVWMSGWDSVGGGPLYSLGLHHSHALTFWALTGMFLEQKSLFSTAVVGSGKRMREKHTGNDAVKGTGYVGLWIVGSAALVGAHASLMIDPVQNSL